MKSDALTFYWQRLRRAPPAELPYRVSQLLRKRRDRLARPSPAETCDPAQVRILATDVGPAADHIPRLHDLVRDEGNRVCEHRFRIFGIDADFGEAIDWHLDPKTGNRWPLDFWGDIRYRDGKSVGGIKFAWELNRLHHWPMLALAYRLTGDERYADELFSQLRSWLDANPYPLGINWISGIELGIRLVNLVYALKLLPYEPGDRDHDALCEFVYRHATHLYRYPSKYSSCANHALAEAIGLFIAGITFRGFTDSAKWQRFGHGVLEREVTRQIYPDGSSFEHSFPYLQFVVDHFLVFLLMCEEHGVPYSPDLPARLRASMRFMRAMLDSNGNHAAIGDDDSGYLLRLWTGTHNNFLSILETGARLLGTPAFHGGAGTTDLKTLLLLAGRTDRCAAPPPLASGADYFDNAGLAVVRGAGKTETLFVGNSGPLGLEPLAGHGHADALSFWLSVGGQPIFVDPGTYLYHSGGVWRNYFRSTAAHNTVRVDAADQAEILADFMFKAPYRIGDAGLDTSEDGYIWHGSHDGYRRLEDPVTHVRNVAIDTAAGTLVIEDRIDCGARHDIEAFFHLHPDCKAEKQDDSVRITCGGLVIELRPGDTWQESELIRADERSPAGWYSSAFNALEATTTIRLAARVTGATTFVTSINWSGPER